MLRRMGWLGVVVLAACQQREADAVVTNPRAEVRAAWLAHRAPWSGSADYNLDDDGLFEETLAKAVRTRCPRCEGGAPPSTRRALDAFISRSEGLYALAQLETDERRAQLEALVRARFTTPPLVTRSDGVVLAQLGFAPAKFEKTRAGWALGDSSLEVDRELAPAEVNRAFCQALRGLPGAKKYEVQVTLPGQRAAWVYTYDSTSQQLTARFREAYVSPAAVGAADAFCAGRVATHTSALTRALVDL